MSVPSLELGPPSPSLQASVVLPGPKWGETRSHAGKGTGGTNRDEGADTLVHSGTLCTIMPLRFV